MSQQVVQRLRQAFLSGATKSISWRTEQLEGLKRFAFENQQVIVDALKKDLRKPEFETKVTELAMFFEDVELTLKNINKWTKPRSVTKPNLLLWGMDKVQMYPEPYGVLLIISPWNYPVQLSLVPMIGAIAAGNCVILKPSEVAPNIERVFAQELPKYLDKDCFAVVTGGVKETQELLENRFDHILYTGSTAVGKVIMQAAAKYLTPVTLELGGKSPCIIDSTANIDTAVRRVAWGKLINAGQSCIAPDYVLIHPSVKAEFIDKYAKTVKSMLGENPQKSDSFGRIINQRHWQRITGLMKTGKIVVGGEKDESDLYISPTVIDDVTFDDPIMKEEIFGPVLPLVSYENIDHAIDYINNNDKPLALYIFSNDNNVIEKVKSNTSSGGFTSNDTMTHAACNTLPFGGVGPSGIGGYHGEHSFLAFSHMKPVLQKFKGLEALNDVRYAPYSKKKLSQILWFVGYPSSLHGSSFTLLYKLLGVGFFGVIIYLIYRLFL